MKRKIPRYFLLAGMGILMGIISAGFVAGQNRVRAARQGLAQRMGLPQLLEMQQFLGGLNLTDDQKAQIKGIFTQNKTQILLAARDVIKARLDMMQGIQGAATELANAQLQAENLRTQIFSQISPLLTQDQIAKVQQRKQLREERLQKLLDRINKQLGSQH